MNESSKTLTYVVIAAVMAAAGIFLAPGGPKVSQDAAADLIGTEFYPEFTAPSEATSIDVIGYDAATATATPFSVKYENGLWRIPTRHNYPADAKDRLAKVAASIIGLKREALAGKTEAQQIEFQVLDPQAEKAENLKGIGNRVTLKKGETVLADYIIGKAVPNRTGYFYVRKPDKKETYIAKVDLNLSTKFTDWIESDVLAIDGVRLTLLDIIKHSLEIKGTSARLAGQERNTLTREKSADPWKLDGLDAETEEVNQDEVRKLVDALDNLKIVGVRPKPESLRKGLSDNEGITLDPQTESDLANRGFFFQPTQRGGMRMISMEGDLIAGTDQAVEYELHFGDAFDGTTEEIEFDFAKPKDDAESKEGEKAADDNAGEKADAEKSDGDKSEPDKSTGKKKSRYLFVTARVNPELLGPEPVEPTKPEPPAETPADDKKPADEKPAEAKEDGAKDEKTDAEKSDEGDASGDEVKDESPEEEQPAEVTPADDTAAEDDDKKKESTEEKPPEEKSTEEKSADEKPVDDAKESPATPPVDPKKAYEDALKQYDADKLKYETDLRSREKKLEEAEEKVKTLNARFAEWYYVISAENFENLRQGRGTLVKEKAAAEKPGEETTPAGDKPDGDKPDGEPADATESNDTPRGDSPKDEDTPKEEPSDTPKSEDDKPKDESEDTPESP